MKKVLNEGYKIHNFMLAVSVRTFLIPFYYGSPMAKSYGSYGSGSATLPNTYSCHSALLQLLQTQRAANIFAMIAMGANFKRIWTRIRLRKVFCLLLFESKFTSFFKD
jgi:hypothetical protein